MKKAKKQTDQPVTVKPLQNKYAIVGMGCNFPGNCKTIDQFWEMLQSGGNGVKEVDGDRLGNRLFGAKQETGKAVTLVGGYIDGIAEFDPLAYGIGYREASQMSLRQRMTLEVAHAALDDAGCVFRGKKIGVFSAGTLDNEIRVDLDDLDEYYVTGTQSSIISNRVSFVFDLRGPSLTLDTACSSSLIAINMAIASLERGDCTQALVTGSNHLQSPSEWIGFSHLGIISPDGLCRAFDKDGNGYARGEGAGAVLIKPLQDAIKDGDRIYSVISGSALNSCGHGMSLTYPGGGAQSEAYKDAFASTSGRLPSDVCFAEFHGTGTNVGDPIECNAAGAFFASGSSEAAPVLIGSVKTNIGHLELASGVAGLIKASLQLYHGTMCPSRNFVNKNEGIKWDSLPIKVCTELTKLLPRSDDGVVVGTVSSFGFGGSNSVVVLESFTVDKKVPGVIMKPQTIVKSLVDFPVLFTVGALSLNATTEFAKLAVDLIEKEQNLYDRDNKISYDISLALSLGRRARIYNYRSFAVSKHGYDLQPSMFSAPELVGASNPVIFCFSGQGPQHYRMGFGLFVRFPVFKQSVLESDAFLKNEFGFSLITDYGLFDETMPGKEKDWPILKVVLSIAVLQIALFDLYVMVLGRTPDAIIGHSVGEIAMLYGCGAVSKQTCLRIAVGRARAMAIVDGSVTGIDTGGMVALGCSSGVALDLIKTVLSEMHAVDGLWLAADNSADAITVAGYTPLIQKLCKVAQGMNIFARALQVGSAFHTPLMEVCKDKMREAMNTAFAKEEGDCIPKIPVSSAVNGRMWEAGKAFSGEYMWKNLRQPVNFRQALIGIIDAMGGDCVFVELAAHPVLASSVSAQVDSKLVVNSMVRPKAGSPDFQAVEVGTFLESCGKLFQLGCDVNFAVLSGLSSLADVSKVALPEYPFHKKFIWPPECRAARADRIAPATTRLGSRILNLSPKKMPWFSYHVIDGIAILPGAAYMSAIFERGARVLRNVTFEKMMSFSPGQTVTALVDVDFDLCKWNIRSSAELISSPDVAVGEAVFNLLHSRGEFSLIGPSNTVSSLVNVDQIMGRCTVPKYLADMHERRKHYYQFGDLFSRVLSGVFVNTSHDELVCDLVLPVEFTEFPGTPHFKVHPGMLDAMFQAVFFLLMEADKKSGRYEHKWLPHSLGRIVRCDSEVGAFDFKRGWRVWVKKETVRGNLFISSIVLFDPVTGQIGMTLDKCVFKLVPADIEDIVVGESLFETFVEYGMPLVEFSVPATLDCMRNVRLYKYTDACAYSYILTNESVINLKANEEDSVDRVRFRLFCKTSLKNFKGPFLNEFSQSEISMFEEEDMVVVTKRIGNLIPQVLSDSSVGAASLLSDDVFTKLFDENMWTQEFNTLIMNSFRECLMQAKAAGKTVLRVLEVGAGSGGLTSFLDSALCEADAMGMHVDYLATDVTTGLEAGLIARIKHRDFGTTQFDIGNPDFGHRQTLPEGSEERGIAPEEFDLIVSACVLHALPSIEPTTKAIFNLLRPGGYLLTVDLNRDSWQSRKPFTLAMDLFLGATKEWFGYNQSDSFRVTDSDLYDCCLLSPAQWKNVLSTSGFVDIQASVESSAVPLGLYLQGRKPAIDAPSSSWPYPITGEPVLHRDPEIVYYHKEHSEMDLVKAVQELHSKSAEQLQVWILATDDAEGAKAVGVGRCLASEYSAWKVMIVTFSASIEIAARTQWMNRLRKLGDWHSDFHYSVSSDGKLMVRKIATVPDIDDTDIKINNEESTWALRTLDPKSRSPFDLMAKQSLFLPVIGDYDVKVKSAALGLNFRGLLTQIGVLDGEQASEMTDFSGVVLQVGSKVTRIAPGDFVMGLADNISNVVLCKEQYAAKVPKDFSAEAAASFFVAFSTAWLSLVTVAGLRKGERVLITQATSSLGLAAIQIAKRRGAEIFCTAGTGKISIRLTYTEKKRIFLTKSMGIDSAAVSDSRNVETWTRDLEMWSSALDVLEGSSRSGLVDVVLNTVSGPGLKEGLQSLRSLGRFVELGKRDVYGETSFKLLNLAKNCSLHIIDFSIILRESPSLAMSIMDDILQAHAIKPFDNYDEHVFPWWQVGDAFKLMKNGTHVGKIILNKLDSNDDSTSLTTSEKPLFSPHRTYILVGGCGGIGVRLARWMVEGGARHFILTSRSGRESVERQGIDQVMELEMLETTAGVDVKVVKADAGKVADMKRVLAACSVPIGGIFQMGVVLRDAAINNVTQQTFDDVYLPKVTAMEVLLKLVDPAEVDFILLFSSLAGFVGNMGQASYVAASCYLDNLSAIPNVVSIEVPSVSQVGVFARMRNNIAALEGLDAYVVSPTQLFSMAGDAIRKIKQCSGPYICSTSWASISSDFPKTVSVYRHLMHRHLAKSNIIAGATSTSSDTIESEVAKLLNLDMGEIQTNSNLSSLGLDSLSAVKLSKLLSQKFGIVVSQMQLLGDVTIGKLIDMRQIDEPTIQLVEKVDHIYDYAADLENIKDGEVSSLGRNVDYSKILSTNPTIFVTGVTGFLGAFIIDSCFKKYPNAKIITLVRAKSDKEGLDRVVDNLKRHLVWTDAWAPNLSACAGDLGSPKFGFGEERWLELCSSVDIIIHNGALVHWIYPYERLRAPNVEGTLTALKMSTLKKLIPIHFVSSTLVLDTPHYTDKALPGRGVNEADNLQGSKHGLRSGYGQTKWVAEQLILRARARGCPATIIRAGFIVGDSRSGVTNTDDFIWRLVKGCVQLGQAPRLSNVVNLCTVDYVADCVVAVASNPAAIELGVFHMWNPHGFKFDDLFASIITTYGVIPTDYSHWRTSLLELTSTTSDHALVPVLHLVLNDLPTSTKAPELSDLNTRAVLIGTEIECPRMELLLPKYLGYLSYVGFLPRDRIIPGVKLPTLKEWEGAVKLVARSGK